MNIEKLMFTALSFVVCFACIGFLGILFENAPIFCIGIIGEISSVFLMCFLGLLDVWRSK
jgi:hypothetical protein